MNRGTGYTATHASWEGGDGRIFATFPIDRSARPWGPDGGPYAKDSNDAPSDVAAYYQRYAGGKGKPGGPQAGVYAIGAWGEALGPQNVPALKRWYEQQSPEHRAKWDGEPTIEEVYDAAFSNHFPGPFYGGGGDVIVDSAEVWDAYGPLLSGGLARGEIRLGEAWSIQLPGKTTATRFLIQWVPDGAKPVDPVEPEEPTDPEEPEEPEEPTDPAEPDPLAGIRAALTTDVLTAAAEASRWIRGDRLSLKRMRYLEALVEFAKTVRDEVTTRSEP